VSSRRKLRCAIYTRKSTEERLEQDFNTLDAQREACAAYIKSQTHEGWRVLAERFDDGGWSGGTLERPALQRLLSDERALITGEEPSRAKVRRIPGREIDGLVRDTLVELFSNPDQLLQSLGNTTSAGDAERAIRQGRQLHRELIASTPEACAERIRPLLHRVVLGDGEVRISLARGSVRAALGLSKNQHADEVHDIAVPARLATSGVGLKLVVGDGVVRSRAPDQALIKLIADAHEWWAQLQSGRAASIRKLAAAENVSKSHMGRVLRLAFLAPDIVEAILEGQQPVELSTRRQLLHAELPHDWSEQRRQLGFTQTKVSPAK
jgi:site-specific DNA recombinase